jgi:hypothetical protein
MEIFSSIPILQLYSKEESYLWANRKEMLECIDIVIAKNMYNPCPLLDNFMEYGRKKEEKKEKQQFMMFLDDKTEKDADEEVFNLGNALPGTPVRSDS